MTMKRRRLVLSLLLLIPGLSSLRAQPTAPTPDANAAIRAELGAQRPVAADVGDGTIPTGNFDLGSVTFLDTGSREQSRSFYRTVYNASEGIPMEWTGSYDTGDSGDTSQDYKDAVLRRINFVRSMAGLPDGVAFDSTFSAKSQDAALIMSANDQLNHYPPNNWLFWTDDGYEAAGKSNLAIGSSGPDSVMGYIEDHGGNNAVVGHRRWLLYPQTQTMGTGDVPGIDGVSNRRPANSIWVFDGNFGGSRPSTRESFVAWPPAGHVPYTIVYPRWSIAVAGANFNGATVTMTRKIGNGSPENVSVVLEPFSSGSGEPTLVWVPDGLNTSQPQTHARPTDDTTYSVSVQISGESQPITYDVVVFDPDVAGSDFEEPVTSGSVSPMVGADNAYSVDVGSLTDQFQWRSFEISSESTVLENGENGDAGLIIGQSHAYDTFASGSGVSGSTALRMNHSTVNQDETIALKGSYLVSSGSQLTFASRRQAVTSSETVAAQVSLDDGGSWSTVWEQTADAQEGSYTTVTVPLADYAGKTIQVRMLFTIEFGSWYPTGGWFVDNIEITNVSEIANAVTSPQSEGQTYLFNPTAATTYGLQVRGVFYDNWPLDWGPTSIVTAAAGSPTAPSITTQPTGGSRDEGGAIDLVVVATGIPSPTYQWKKDGVDVAGATSATLSLTDLDGEDAGAYTVVVTNSQGSETSDEAVVDVVLFTAPVITDQPTGGNLTVGESIALSVVASGNPTPTYQWKKDGANLDDDTASTLTLTDVDLDDSGSYTVVVSNVKGSVTSEPAEVTVSDAVMPTITAQPDDAAGEAGGSVLFTVLASGTPPFSYQWWHDGQAIAAATTATLSLTDLDPDDAGAYSVVITNDAGSVTSASGNLTVNASDFGGAYFGSPTGEAGELALWIRGDNRAVFALFIEDGLQGLLEREVQIQGDGSFSFEGPSAFGTVSGQITGSNLTGQVAGLSLNFTGTLSDPDGSTAAWAGAYPVSVATESGSDVIVIAGGDATAMIFAPSSDADTGDAFVGSIDGAGAFAGTTEDGVDVQLQFRVGSVSGSFDDGTDTGFLGGYRYGSVAPNLLANISMRGNVGIGDSIMIAGFVVAGSGQKPILVRAVGPTLTDFSVDGAISDPEMVVGALGGADISSNDNWEDVTDQAELESLRARVGAFPLGVGNADSALPLQLTVGSFTSRISGVGDVTGIALVEVYDTDDHEAGPAAAQLANISMRGSVGTGAGIMIAGFVVQAGHDGDVGVPKQVLIRGVGPTLGGFGVGGTISDPLLQLFNSANEVVAENDNWQEVEDVDTLQGAFTSVGAFNLDDGSSDSALLIWLLPGLYTAQISGVNDATGVALVEVYAVP